MELLSSSQDSPKFIDQIPGRRVPYWAPVEMTISANDTSRQEGTHNVSTDGPFAVTGIAAFYKRTTGAYAGFWGPATTVGNKIASASQGQGFAYLLDQPHTFSCSIEIVDEGSSRNWQERPVASALWSPDVGNLYMLPIAALFSTASTITVKVTPDVEMPQDGLVQVNLCGYKIVQGQLYQP